MATKHGNRKYYQLLIEPNKAALIEKLAAQSGVRATAYMRDALTTHLALNCNRDEFLEAVNKDEELWRQSVINRVAGRKKAKLTRAETPARKDSNWWKQFFFRDHPAH